MMSLHVLAVPFSRVMDAPSIRIKTYPEVKGYVNGDKIVDSDNMQSALVMPGGRDLRDIKMRHENGVEIMDITNYAMEYISEESIGTLPDDLTEVELHTNQAVWYSVGDKASRTITLEIPDNATVYVYDAYDCVTYTSYMTESGGRISGYAFDCAFLRMECLLKFNVLL